jgi:hypothetical protein
MKGGQIFYSWGYCKCILQMVGKTLGTPDIDGRIILKGPLKTLYWANSDRVLQGPIVITEMHIGGFI